MEIKEKFGFKTEWRIDRFKDPSDLIAKALEKGISLEEAIAEASENFLGSDVFEGNLGLNEGLQELIDIICGLGTPTKWDSANARLGVGDSNAAENATHTGLQAVANKTFKAMDATFPQRSAQTAEWRSTFGSADANYAWEEYTVVNAADDSGKNLNRKVASKGTKASGESWVLSLKITFS
jgi:hypothetical protein